MKFTTVSLIEFIREIFQKEKCIKCGATLSKNDRNKGGAAYISGRFHQTSDGQGTWISICKQNYCVNCLQRMVIDLSMGKDPEFPEMLR